MKKVFISVLAVIVILLSFSGCSICDNNKDIVTDNGTIMGYGDNFSPSSRKVNSFNTDGVFTVLQFTDTHLFSADKKKDKKTLDAISKSLEENKVDLAVVLGDMVDGKNNKKYYNKEAALRSIAQVFEDNNIYWAYVPGNNDGEYLGSNNDVLALLGEYKHCIFSSDDNTDGDTQYVVDIYKGKKIVHSLVFLDTGGKENGEYTAIPQSEIKWLDNALGDNDRFYSVFMHKNTPDFTIAAEYGTPYSDNYDTISKKTENDIPSNIAFDNVIKKHKNVGLVSIGHIHPKNNECSFYNGIYYHIGKPSGYEKSKKPGATLIKIKTNAKSIEDMYEFQETKL